MADFHLRQIGYIHSDFPEKFGVPRQSGLAQTKAELIFLPPFRQADAVRGLEAFSHVWIIWQFSENLRRGKHDRKADNATSGTFQWSATVRPPRLGGNARKGVFATRSPFRPNPIGLSCVELEGITFGDRGPVLHLIGADMVDGTPVYDVKPYLPYADCVPTATGGFTDQTAREKLEVVFPEDCLRKVPEAQREALIQVLEQDPRPSYQNDPRRVYGMTYAGIKIKFVVELRKLTVISLFL